MKTQIQLITKSMVDAAANKLENDGIAENRSGRKFHVEINGKFFPYGLLIEEAAKIGKVKLSKFDYKCSEFNRNNFEKYTSYKARNKYSDTPFFIIEEFDNLHNYAGKNGYDKNNPVLLTYQEQIKKLKLLASEVFRISKIRLQVCRVERINRQAGRGAKKLNWSDYILVGYNSGKRYFGRTLFLKIAIHYLDKGPYLTIEVDVDRVSKKSKASYLVTTFVDSENNNYRYNNPLNFDFDLIEYCNSLKEVVNDNLGFLKKAESIMHQELRNVSKDIGYTGDNELKNTQLNQILFGPPGTGKTYNTIIKSVEIIDPDFVSKNDFEQIKERFDTLLKNEQIVFTTFHQSMSYEDFIEGIKPVPPIKEGHPVTYKVEDGIFKQICENAKSHKESNTFDKVYNKFVNDVKSDEDFELKTLHRTKPFQVKINSNNSCVAIPKTDTATNMVIKKSAILKYLTDGTIKDWKPYLTAISEYIKSTYHLELDDLTTVDKSYVLIIDEINRGNVSSIFGELITLIEGSKRQGSKEALEITLPYSKEPFSVPNNLYILGTMNTADRSVEALDSALRRRFSFTEMPPDSKLVKEKGKVKDGIIKCKLDNKPYKIDLPKILDVINDRLEVLLDKDHLIGHSYFMKVTNIISLQNAFYNEIIPLLQEYFFGDYGKIAMVLGEGFCKRKKTNTSKLFATVSDYEVPDYSDKLIFEINILDDDAMFVKAIDTLLNVSGEEEK